MEDFQYQTILLLINDIFELVIYHEIVQIKFKIFSHDCLAER